MTTRTFLFGATIAIVGAAIALPDGEHQKARQYTGGRFMLDIMGSNAGFLVEPPKLAAASGQTPSAATPITLQMGFSMSRSVYDWINASWQNSNSRKNGAIVACNFNYEAMSSREFFGALITEVGFPAFDASQKSPASMRVTLHPQRTITKPRTGLLPRPDPNSQKAWHSSNFRFEMGGLPCARISRVEAFAVKSGAPLALSFHINSADAPAWQAAMSSAAEKTGALVFLAPNVKDELGRLSFRMTRVRMVQPSTMGPGSDGQARSQVWIAFSVPKLSSTP